MKRMSKLHVAGALRPLRTAVLTLALMCSLGLTAGFFSIVSHAASAGRVTSSDGAKVRSSASTSADVLTSYPKDTVISIRAQIQGTDGTTWYEVHTDDSTIGYVRSDLVEITDGSTPPTSTQVTPTSTEAPAAATTPPATEAPVSNETPAEVSAVNPVSATVTGSGNGGVRVRSNASTTSPIVTTVQNGLALTVTGQATGADSKVWYQVNFIADANEVTGFIRSDFVELSEELTPYTEPEDSPEPEDGGEEDQGGTTSVKQYDTMLRDDGEWILVTDFTKDPPEGYKISDVLNLINSNAEVEETIAGMEKNLKVQKVAIVVLVFLLVVAAGAVGVLAFKMKDLSDSAYFNEVESETLRRRSSAGGQRGMQGSGAERRGASQGQRPAGARPAGAPQGQRPAGARPTGAPQSQRPAGTRPAGASQGQRPAGTRPAGASQGQRPAGARPTGAPQSQRPAGARPTGAPQSQRPAGTRPAGAPQGQKPAGAPGGRPVGGAQNAGRPQSRNFMAEDEEMEFEFLNYDDDNE